MLFDKLQSLLGAEYAGTSGNQTSKRAPRRNDGSSPDLIQRRICVPSNCRPGRNCFRDRVSAIILTRRQEVRRYTLLVSRTFTLLNKGQDNRGSAYPIFAAEGNFDETEAGFIKNRRAVRPGNRKVNPAICRCPAPEVIRDVSRLAKATREFGCVLFSQVNRFGVLIANHLYVTISDSVFRRVFSVTAAVKISHGRRGGVGLVE